MEQTPTAAGSPEVRGAWVKQALAAVDRLPAEKAQRVRARLRSGLLADVDGAGLSQWVPPAWIAEVATAVYEALPRDEADELWRQKALATLEQPLLAHSVRFLTSVLGIGPEQALRWAVKPKLGFGLTFRGCGRLEVESVGADAAVLVYRDLAPALLGSDAWCASSHGTFAALLHLGGAELTSFSYERDPNGRDLRYRLGIRVRAGAPR